MKQLKNYECEDTKATIDKYKDMNSAELSRELMRLVKESKEQGNFDEQSIRQFVDNVSPSLSEEQRRKMAVLVDSICHN